MTSNILFRKNIYSCRLFAG